MTELDRARMPVVNHLLPPLLQTDVRTVQSASHRDIDQGTKALKGEDVCWQAVSSDLTDLTSLFSPKLETVSVGSFPASSFALIPSLRT